MASSRPTGTRAGAAVTPNVSFPYGAPAPRPTATTAAPAATKRISAQKLNPHKCADPFQNNIKKCRTLFSQSYVSGAIPCRLQSSASRHSLQWDDGARSGFSPDLLVVCADGLSETEHPYTLLAPMMFHELCMRAEGCIDMFAPVMEPVAMNLRKALMAGEATFDPALNALDILVSQSGNLIFPFLAKLVPCLAKGFRERRHRERVAAVLGLLEAQCGPEATKVIKAKIPTY